MNNVQVVDSRPKGAFPISIGTSLAIEAVLGIYPERPVVTPAPLLSVKQVWFNLRTLIRNIVSCVPTADRDLVTVAAVDAALREEVSILQAIIGDNSNRNVGPNFYYSDYEHVDAKTFRGATIKVPSTPAQQAYDVMEKAVIDGLKNAPMDTHVWFFKGPIVGRFDRAFIITHCPVDLLARYRFVKLELLESHTGAIKPYPMWASKLSGTAKIELPFNAFTLKLFGDGVHFLGLRPTLKKAVLAVAEVDHWTGLTTDDKIKNSLKKIPDSNVANELLELL